MMKSTEEENQKPNSSTKRASKASFVDLEEERKKEVINKRKAKFREWLLNRKRQTNSVKQKIIVWAKIPDYQTISKESSIYLLEAFVEGLLINYVAKILFGQPMNAFTILAYGIVVKQGINIFIRLKEKPMPETGKTLKKPENNEEVISEDLTTW